jgi:hypothetical protein
MGRFLLALIVIGGVLGFLGVQEMRLASGCKDQPQTLSCKDLAANGFGDNAHVILTDFLSPPSDFVYEEKSGRYTKVWLPVVSMEGDYARRLVEAARTNPNAANLPRPSAQDIAVIVTSSKAPDDAAVTRMMEADTLQGVITNKIESISGKERKLLQEAYPGVNFDKTYILEAGRSPAGAAKSMGMLGGGALLAVGGVAGFFLARRSAA